MRTHYVHGQRTFLRDPWSLLMIISLPTLIAAGFYFYDFLQQLSFEEMQAVFYSVIHTAACVFAVIVGIIGYELWSSYWW